MFPFFSFFPIFRAHTRLPDTTKDEGRRTTGAARQSFDTTGCGFRAKRGMGWALVDDYGTQALSKCLDRRLSCFLLILCVSLVYFSLSFHRAAVPKAGQYVLFQLVNERPESKENSSCVRLFLICDSYSYAMPNVFLLSFYLHGSMLFLLQLNHLNSTRVIAFTLAKWPDASCSRLSFHTRRPVSTMSR